MSNLHFKVHTVIWTHLPKGCLLCKKHSFLGLCMICSYWFFTLRSSLSHHGFNFWVFFFFQHAVRSVCLEGPLERVRQQLGHAVVQLHRRACQRHLIFVICAFGVQVAEEGKGFLEGERTIIFSSSNACTRSWGCTELVLHSHLRLGINKALVCYTRI